MKPKRPKELTCQNCFYFQPADNREVVDVFPDHGWCARHAPAYSGTAAHWNWCGEGLFWIQKQRCFKTAEEFIARKRP